MADDSTDVLMRIVGKGTAFAGQSGTQFSVNPIIDTLRRDFEPGQFSELQQFSFAGGVTSALSASAAQKAKDEKDADHDAAPTLSWPSAKPATPAGSRWGKVRDSVKGGASGTRPENDFVDIQPVEFTRVLDSSSTLLFKALVECETLDSISIAKRKASGSGASGVVYLRLDFFKVLMIDLSWKEGEHVMLETGKFIARRVMVRYRPQKPDGTLGPIIQTEWQMP